MNLNPDPTLTPRERRQRAERGNLRSHTERRLDDSLAGATTFYVDAEGNILYGLIARFAADREGGRVFFDAGGLDALRRWAA